MITDNYNFNFLASSLVSASMDRTIIIWEYDNENEIWMDKVLT